VISLSIRSFIRSKKKYTFASQKGRINLQGPKHGFWGTKSVWFYDPSIRNFIWMKKIHAVRGEKGENKPSEPKH
jgi:hypothetical protein